MSLIKRLTTTITSSFDSAVRRVENHDAVIDAALKDARQAAARTRVRLARVQKDGEALAARRRELAEAATRWAQRARSIAGEDEAKALACLRRRRECEAQVRGLDTALARHRELEARVADNLKNIETRIAEVTQQRNVMRSRQSAADAMRILADVEGVTCGQIEDTFDRWEVNLGETEIFLGAHAPADTLDSEFAQEEDDAALRAELDELLRDGPEASS